MPGIDLSGGAAGKQSQQRPKTFTPAADCVDDVTFDRGIECRGLLRECASRPAGGVVELIFAISARRSTGEPLAFATARRLVLRSVRAKSSTRRG
jgi:hypothetical protein